MTMKKTQFHNRWGAGQSYLRTLSRRVGRRYQTGVLYTVQAVDSPLHRMSLLSAAISLDMTCRRIWRQLVDAPPMTDAQFIAESERIIEQIVERGVADKIRQCGQMDIAYPQ
jgi:hypothetical protein